MCWGGAIALAGLAPNVWIALLFLVLAGAADMISGIFRSVIWHQTIPDEKRGRLAGIEMLSYSIGPLGGQARSGLVADATSVRASIVSGGVLCVLGVAGDRGLAARLLALRRPHRRARRPRAPGPRRTRRGPLTPPRPKTITEP